MLSAARRVDARRGLGGMEEENELEEGEAYSGQEDGRCIDPDALSYIDEKIQDVLGHFQKDFEAGVSAENLGAKFGGYGSFLPTYQRSPSILCHPKSPHKVGNQNVTKYPAVEVTNQNTSVMLNSSFPKSNATAVPLVDNSCKRDISTNKPNTQDPSSLRSPFSKTADGSDHKMLKLRIKVGPDNNLARNNAAIYSGLGLDISPSSSSEESPDGSNGIFPEPHDTFDESPRTILKVMTSLPIPGVNLLSPLRDCLFHSIEKDLPLNKPRKQGKLSKERSDTTSGFIDFSIHSRESNGQPEKPTKLSKQNGRSKGAKYQEDKGAVIFNREIDIEARPVQELASNSFGRVSSNSKSTKKAEGQIGENTTLIETKTLDYPLDVRKDLSRDKPITGPTKDRQFELVDSTIDNGAGYLANRINQSKGKLNEKTSMTQRTSEDRNADFQKNVKSDLQREVRLKTDKDSEIPNADISGEKRRNEQVAEAADQTKQSSSPFKDMVLQRKDQLSDKKSKVITSQSESGEVVKASVCGSLATTLNEKKKKLEKKSKGKKSLKYPSGSCANESYGNSDWVVKAEETGVGSSNNLKVKNKNMKCKDEESILPSQPVKERSGGKKMGSTLALGTSVGEPVPVPLTCNDPAADATIAPQASIVIEENWVQCDICQKWRLLPYGTNPGHLPSKWQCNLLNWLPGMNSCHLSEDDTTNALHALYIAPTSKNVASLDGFGHSVASTSLASGVHLGVPTIKKKNSQKDASVLNQSISTEFPIAVKKEDHISVNDTNQYLPAEINSSNKGTVGTLGKSADFRTEKHKPKQKDKHKNHGFYPNGGNQSEKNEKHSKSKGKRMIDQDGLRTPKKHKKESLQSLEYDVKGNPSPSSNKVRNDVQFFNNGHIKDHLSTSDVEKSLSTKKKLMRHEIQHNQKGFMTSQNEDSRVNIKEIFSESESVQDKKADLLTFEGKISKTNNLNNRMDKKQTISKTVLAANGDYLPDEMDEEATNLVEKECPSRQSQENATFSRDLDFGSLRRDSMKMRGTNSVQPSLAANSSSSKVSGSHKSRSNLPESKGSPVESVSSSPLRIPTMEKQSCKKDSDKKYETNTDRSVLRSPKRCLDVEVDGRNRPSAKRRKDMVSSFQKQSIEGHKAANSAILDSLGGTVDYLEKGRTRSTVSKYEENLLVKQSVHDKLLPIENGDNPYKDDYQDIKKVNRQHQIVDPTHRTSGKSSSGFKEKHRDSKSDSDKSRLKPSCSHSDNKDLNSANNARSYRLEVTTDSCRNEKDDIHGKYVKDCSLKKGHSSRWMASKADNSLTFALQDNMDTNGSSMLSSQQRNLDSKNSVTGARSLKPEFQATPLEHEKTMNQNGSHKTRIPDLLSGQAKSEFKLASGDKQETQAPDIVSSPLKQRRSDGEMVDAVTTDALKVGKQHKHPDSHTGVHHSNMRHALPSGPDTSSPMRKENHTLLVKEARDLKHTANRLKIEGRELESTSLFFQAALKFLHIASLLEPATFDSAKLAEAAQMYFETAKLCEFVARECERIKDMASAALAYKCIEVAFLKAAYCKNPNASRDRHELQAAFQFHPPGESPSSSASDVDNLNNQALLVKNASVKGVSSPQVAGNHILAARHHLQVMRLLHYTNDLNCAFEATRKSQISIAAASANLDKDRPDTLSSVRKALDFNFHDVEGLLRLVRLSLESIGH
ncbi:LOW QUALITY PROTEIN: cysteine-tryptophan domain-containing zinc finger protein 7-like [Curcuma longa]|uniref:LOW QUALITY PROTEIN: cysteine-tryptophan domain-containing zinc finger protein 7-like n=1 Tax=Curcuma longa TaxID=136217 RepID=UPI003D9F4A20